MDKLLSGASIVLCLIDLSVNSGPNIIFNRVCSVARLALDSWHVLLRVNMTFAN